LQSPAGKHDSSKKNKKSLKTWQQQSSPLTKSDKHRELCRDISAPLGLAQSNGLKKRQDFRRNRSCSMDDLDQVDAINELGDDGNMKKGDMKEIKALRKRSTTSTGVREC